MSFDFFFFFLLIGSGLRFQLMLETERQNFHRRTSNWTLSASYNHGVPTVLPKVPA